MEWIDVNEKHFVDIEYHEGGSYTWEENNNCPNNPFLVAIRTNKGWAVELVVLDESHGIANLEGNDIGWSITDVHYWMEIINPKED